MFTAHDFVAIYYAEKHYGTNFVIYFFRMILNNIRPK